MISHFPTIKQLQYLVALRQHGHFGRAAEACFVTQSTLSAGLRELESLLGIVLVERTRRVVRFTPLGQKIAEKALRVLRESEELSRHGPRRGQAAPWRASAGRHPDHRAVPAAGDASAAPRPMAEPQAVPARGDQPGGLRRAPSRPARLRAARPPLRLRRRRQGAAVRRPPVRRLPARRSARRVSASRRGRSTRIAC